MMTVQGSPYQRYQIEPERSPEDYFARQNIIHTALRKTIANQFYKEQSDLHSGSSQTQLARNQSLIEQEQMHRMRS